MTNYIYDLTSGKILGSGENMQIEDFDESNIGLHQSSQELSIDELQNSIIQNDAIVMDTTSLLNKKRQSSSISRALFCIALKRAGILTTPEATQASKGEVPVPLQQALAFAVLNNMMTTDEAEEAEILWAGLTIVERLHPITLLAQSSAQLTDAQVDAIFGIV